MKKLISALTFTFLSLSAFSVSLEDFSLSVEPLFGLRRGQIDEYVFLKKSNFSNDKLSELNWEIRPEWYYGFNIHGGLKQFFVETGLKFGVSGETGQMMDSDWLNAQTSSMPRGVSSKKAAGHDYKTHYSEHDNNLDYDINFNIKGGYEFRIFEIFGIKPSLSYDYQNIKFTGRNGKGWYGLGLHAYKLTLKHPKTGEEVTFTAPYPKDMDATRKQLANIFGVDPLASENNADK